jgi:hypothetical protein
MVIKINQVYQILEKVLPGKVSYMKNESDKGDQVPFIVYQTVRKKSVTFADNQSILKETTFQVNLVTQEKDILLEQTLETEFAKSDLETNQITEFLNQDNSLTVVFEITY